MSRLISSIQTWAEMVKLSHSVFALPFAMTAALLAGRQLPDRRWPYWGQLLLVVMCMVAARSVAMTFNRIVDAQIDLRNPRTAGRPLPSGRLSFAAAWGFLAVSALTFGIACLGFAIFFGNTWPILLSGLVLAYLCGYSFAKRFTRWSHLYLGSAIALSPLAAWLAIDPGSLGWPALLLTIAVSAWISGFDIIYACQDIEVDRREGLHSLPASLGPAAALWIARGLHGVTVAALWGVGALASLGAVYFAGVIIVALLLIFENALVRPGDYRRVNLAFFTVNGVVSVAWAASVFVDLWWTRG